MHKRHLISSLLSAIVLSVILVSVIGYNIESKGLFKETYEEAIDVDIKPIPTLSTHPQKTETLKNLSIIKEPQNDGILGFWMSKDSNTIISITSLNENIDEYYFHLINDNGFLVFSPCEIMDDKIVLKNESNDEYEYSIANDVLKIKFEEKVLTLYPCLQNDFDAMEQTIIDNLNTTETINSSNTSIVEDCSINLFKLDGNWEVKEKNVEYSFINGEFTINDLNSQTSLTTTYSINEYNQIEIYGGSVYEYVFEDDILLLTNVDTNEILTLSRIKESIED